MRDEKKGEMYSSVIKYMLMAIFSLIVLVAGFKSVAFIRDRACNAELAQFEIELSGIDKELRFGAKELKEFRIPCKASQIYFFDISKKINPDDFKDIPILKNALATGSSKNVFIIDQGKVKKSFYAGNIETIYPYHLCLKPLFDKISFSAEGKGKSALVTGACGQPDCTRIPINITEEEAQRIIAEAINSQLGCDKCKFDDELQNIRLTKEKVELFRRFIVCDGITKVEIIISPQKGAEIKNFRYYEYMPKECVDDLSIYIQELGLENNVIVQENDPLLVWHFDEIEKETVLSYELDKELSESCRIIIEGLGVMHTIQSSTPPPSFCGDKSCNSGETCSTCTIDCGTCIVQVHQPAIPPAVPPAPCVDECSISEKNCPTSFVEQECGNFDADTCREFGNAQLCRQSESCQQGQGCVSSCTPKAKKDCVGDEIYWFDSCGQRGILYFDCRRNNIGIGDRDDCNNGKCCFGGGIIPLGCRDPGDRCPTSCPPGQQRCSGSGFEKCDDDDEGCFKWGKFTPCLSGCDSSTNKCKGEN